MLPNMGKPVGVGVIGCGSVACQYLKPGGAFECLRFVACSDILPDAAQAVAAEFGIPKACSNEELLADPEVEVVLNLTIPSAHYPLAMATLDAGKHTYLEKPLAITRELGLRIMDKARQKNRKVGCAPDTFMGRAIQTARKAIDDGLIGRPVGFNAFMMLPGHEKWHPNPEFHYDIGGGPLFDMGPYYLTALLNLLGPVKRLCALAAIEIPDRTIGSKAKFGKVIDVRTPDHMTGSIEFECGAVGSIILSFATHHGPYGQLVIFGSEGTLEIPDPNHHTGNVRFRAKDSAEWSELKPAFTHEYYRSVGLAEMAQAIRNGGSFRASGEQGLAVLDLMEGFLESSAGGKHFTPTVAYQRPAPVSGGKSFENLSR